VAEAGLDEVEEVPVESLIEEERVDKSAKLFLKRDGIFSLKYFATANKTRKNIAI
jgi:hypothetical protein